MVVNGARKRILCAICDKKCTGNVLRYQDRYYHKQCFEQSDSRPPTGCSDNSSSVAPPATSHNTSVQRLQLEDSQQDKNQQMPSPQPARGGPTRLASTANCAGCRQKISDGQALVALDLHWHIWCFKCNHCQVPLHGEYVAKENRAYCEKDYQRLFGVLCVYCKRYITGKVLQAGEAHHFHPSCARCSKCGDPFVPGEEMYLQGEVTWHPRCGPGPGSEPTGPLGHEELAEASSRSQLRPNSPSLSSRSRSASPFSYISRQVSSSSHSPNQTLHRQLPPNLPLPVENTKYGRTSPGYADSEAVGDLSRIYTISYLNADPTQGYLRRPIEPNPPKSPQFSRPASAINRDHRSRSSSRSQVFPGGSQLGGARERSVPRGMYSVLSSMRSAGSSVRARSPSMMNEEAIQLAAYPSGQRPSPDAVPKIERDDFPAPPFPYSRSNGRASGTKDHAQGSSPPDQDKRRQERQQQRSSRPRSREIVIDDDESSAEDPQLRKEEEELSKIASGIGKIFLQTLKEREKLRAWKRANLDPRNASRTPSAQRELPSRMRYDNPTNASPSRDLDRPRVWGEDDEGAASEHSPTRTRSSLGKPSQMSSSAYGYKVVQSNRSTPRPGYGLSTNGLSTLSTGTGAYPEQSTHYTLPAGTGRLASSQSMSFAQHQRSAQNRSNDLLLQSRTLPTQQLTGSNLGKPASRIGTPGNGSSTSMFYASPHLRRSMPNVNNLQHLHQEGPPKLYPYHLLATSNYRLPPGVDRCHLERHLSNEEFQYIFHCDRLDFYRLPEWKRNELKRRARLF